MMCVLLIRHDFQMYFRTFKVSSRKLSPTGVASVVLRILRVGQVKQFLSRPTAPWARTSVRTKRSEFQADGYTGKYETFAQVNRVVTAQIRCGPTQHGLSAQPGASEMLERVFVSLMKIAQTG